MSKPSISRCLLVAGAAALGLSGCGDTSAGKTPPAAHSAATSTTNTIALPGSGKPAVTIGDKNFSEQFVLGELYYQALQAQGFSVSLNRNIGPTEVRVQALESGRLDLYPEYIDVWDSAVAGYKRTFRAVKPAFRAGQRYARAHGLRLLEPTPFSDTGAIGVTALYAISNHVRTVPGLQRWETSLTLGGPPQFKSDPGSLPALEQTYGVFPQNFMPLDVGAQYQALDQGQVQAAAVNTTDGELASGHYRLLGDPAHVFGVGQVVPVTSAKVLAAEGPAFATTVNAVSGLLSTRVMRRLNAAVDVYHQDPYHVAQQFLVEQGLVPPPSS